METIGDIEMNNKNNMNNFIKKLAANSHLNHLVGIYYNFVILEYSEI